jgi:hypothetical protein
MRKGSQKLLPNSSFLIPYLSFSSLREEPHRIHPVSKVIQAGPLGLSKRDMAVSHDALDLERID